MMDAMLLEQIQKTEQHLRRFLLEQYDVEFESLSSQTPPRVEFGDLAFPFAFELAGRLRRPPRQIAEEVVSAIEVPPWIERFSAAGAGYVNAFFRRRPFFERLHQWLGSGWPAASGQKIIVEHTNINPNKAAHIGHLRNAALGDTLVRLLRARGRRVEVQNYIDNTGVQVADVVVGFRYLRRLSLEQMAAIPDGEFDDYCWDLYAEVSEWYRQDASRQQYRESVLQEIEGEEEPTASLARQVSSRIVMAHLKTMLRLGVRYQVLPQESEILHLNFWEEAFRMLREKGAVEYREEGPNQGCWVMPLGEGSQGEADEKIIVRSNGTVTYVGKDIAYQLWKFGLLGKDFHYRPLCRYQDGSLVEPGETPDSATVWTTSCQESPQEPSFGHASMVYNVIDVRQSYLQNVVVEGLRRLGFQEEAKRSVHFAYEMVALSPACCQELGIELDEADRERPYVEVSGRRGLGVKADDLIDTLIEKSTREVASRHPQLNPALRSRIASQISIGALRYFLLKYTRGAVIAFDFAQALSFEGETGPYLQYSVVRANNIFRKLEEKDGEWEGERWKAARSRMWQESALDSMLEDEGLWELLLQAARLEQFAEQSIRNLEISILAKQTFALAQQFNLFYHRHHILSESDPLKRCFYLTVADTVRSALVRMLDLLGIEVPEKM